MKGEVSILLKRDGKVVQRVKANNLVTNAVNEFYHLALKATPSGQSSGSSIYVDYVLAGVTNTGEHENVLFPIPEKGLGGILLFDGALNANASHIKLRPNDPHIIGFANQAESYQSHQAKWRGKISDDSGEIENGYRLVWEWKDEALLGQSIYALALTNSRAGANFGPFVAPIQYASDWRGDYYLWGRTPGTGFFYYQKNITESGIGTAYKFLLDAYQDFVRITIDRYSLLNSGQVTRVDTVYEQDFYYVQFDYSETSAGQWITYGHDGYAYLVFWTTEGSLKYFKIDLSDAPTFSITVEERVLPELDEIGGRTIQNGYFYFAFTENHTRKLGRMRLSDGEVDYVSSISFFPRQAIGGNIISDDVFGYSRYSMSGDYDSTPILWPCAKEPESSSHYIDGLEQELQDLDDDSLLVVHHSSYGDYLYLNPGYLGTIYNLPTPITKNSDNETIVIQYDLIME